MELQVLQTLASESLTELGLEIEGHFVDGDPAVDIVDPIAQPPRLVAVITDHRTDRFSLRLAGYTFQDFAWEPADQRVVVGDYCKIVAGYLRGEGTYGVTPPLFGFLGRVRPTYSIVIDGTNYGAVAWDSGRTAT